MGVNLYNHSIFIFFERVLKLWLKRRAHSCSTRKPSEKKSATKENFRHSGLVYITAAYLIDHCLINSEAPFKFQIPICPPSCGQYDTLCLNKEGNQILLDVIKLLRLCLISTFLLRHSESSSRSANPCCCLVTGAIGYIEGTQLLGSVESSLRTEKRQALLTFLFHFQNYIKTLNPSETEHYLYYCLSCWFTSSATYPLPKNLSTIKIFYTYVLIYQPNIGNGKKQSYYMGYRGCTKNPNNDVYYSSSKTVKNLVKQYGTKPVIKRILGVFVKPSTALAYEIAFHTEFQVGHNESYLNQACQTSSGFSYHRGAVVTEESEKKISESLSGRTKDKGKKIHTPDSKQKISDYHTNVRTRPAEEIALLQDWAIKRSLEIVTCPYCGKEGKLNAMAGWHFEHCKEAPILCLETQKRRDQCSKKRQESNQAKIGTKYKSKVKTEITNEFSL